MRVWLWILGSLCCSRVRRCKVSGAEDTAQGSWLVLPSSSGSCTVGGMPSKVWDLGSSTALAKTTKQIAAWAEPRRQNNMARQTNRSLHQTVKRQHLKQRQQQLARRLAKRQTPTTPEKRSRALLSPPASGSTTSRKGPWVSDTAAYVLRAQQVV